ncbi:glycosyltransferase family 2 protein [Chloroflexota bacterium]
MNTNKPIKTASILIIIYNGMLHIENCVLSVLNQTFQSFEIILVDNNSTDGSLNYIKNKFPQLTIVACNENLGYGGGINRGLQYATGDYIAPLNQDTEVDKNWLVFMLQFLKQHPMVGAVCPRSMIYNDRTRISAIGADIHVSGFSYSRAKYQSGILDLDTPIEVNGVSGSSYVIRKSILEQMGGLEPCFGGMDDTVLSWNLHLMGYKIYCIPRAIIYHKHQMELSPNRLFYLERDRVEMLLTSLKPFTLFVSAPFFILIELLVVSYCLLRGRAYVCSKINMWWSVLRDFKKIRTRRRQMNKLRTISDLKLFRSLKLIPDWPQLLRAFK